MINGARVYLAAAQPMRARLRRHLRLGRHLPSSRLTFVSPPRAYYWVAVGADFGHHGDPIPPHNHQRRRHQRRQGTAALGVNTASTATTRSSWRLCEVIGSPCLVVCTHCDPITQQAQQHCVAPGAPPDPRLRVTTGPARSEPNHEMKPKQKRSGISVITAGVLIVIDKLCGSVYFFMTRTEDELNRNVW
eukprot:COSAG01_NODE_19874_length_984_cov_1.518644_1_plen_190_part_00